MIMLFIFFVVIICPHIYENQFITKDCYKSFSNNEEYFEFFHYYPTGPPYLFLKLELKLYSYIFGFVYKNTFVHYHLKRISGLCKSSWIFSTIGEDFKKMHISIKMSLYFGEDKIGDIKYIFYPSFDHDNYILIDENENFGLVTQVLNVKHELFIAINSSRDDAISYLGSLSLKNGEVCVVTQNNRGVVLKPNNDSFIIHGLISSVSARIIKDEEILLQKEYPAFGCYKNNDYLNETVVFIVDIYKYDLSFDLSYWQISRKISKIYLAIFKISNELFADVRDMNNLPRSYKKLFLMDTEETSKYFFGGKSIVTLKNFYGITYISKELNIIEVSRCVKQSLWVYDSRLNSCGI